MNGLFFNIVQKWNNHLGCGPLQVLQEISLLPCNANRCEWLWLIDIEDCDDHDVGDDQKNLGNLGITAANMMLHFGLFRKEKFSLAIYGRYKGITVNVMMTMYQCWWWSCHRWWWILQPESGAWVNWACSRLEESSFHIPAPQFQYFTKYSFNIS